MPLPSSLSGETTLYKHPALDPWCVKTTELRSVISDWSTKHTARFVFIDGEQGGMTAYQYIIEHAPFAVSDKSLSRIMHLETKTTSLGICDNILAAIDDTGAIEDGRISLIPNPTWSKSKWKNWSREEFREAAKEV